MPADGEDGVFVTSYLEVCLSADVTCEAPHCPFSQLPTLPSHLELCEQVFGFSLSSVVLAVAQTNAYYGGQMPGASRVLFVNGEYGDSGADSLSLHCACSQTVLFFLPRGHRPLACAKCNPEFRTL